VQLTFLREFCGNSVGMSPHQPDTEDDRSEFRTRCDGGGAALEGREVVGSCVSAHTPTIWLTAVDDAGFSKRRRAVRCAALPDETHQIDIWAHCASAGEEREREIHIPDAVCPG